MDVPAVVLVAALGDGGDCWQPVVDRLEGLSVVAYDRPGTGSAPPRPEPNPPLPYSAFAAELAGLLDAVDRTGPVVLAGHSIGASIVRVFAGRHPERVAGLVFLDGSIPQNMTWPETDFPVDGEGAGATAFDVVAGHAELLRAEPLDVPAVVVTRRRRWWVPDYAAIPHPAIDDIWYESQRLLARDWRAPLIVAERSGHQVPREAPALSAYVIGAVAEAAAAGRRVVVDPARVAEIGGAVAAPGRLPATGG